MKYSEVFTKVAEKPSVVKTITTLVGDKYIGNVDKVNDHIRRTYVEPQARAATDASFDQLKNNLVNYGIPALAGAGVAGLGAYSVAEWINEHRKKQKATDAEVLPSKLLASLAAAGGAIGGVMLYDRYGKKASYGDIPVVPDPALEVSPEEQEALEDPSKSKKKKKEKTPDKIKQMIYAQNAKTRREQMKNASLTYSKVAEAMVNTTNNQTTTQGNGTVKFDQSTQTPKFITPKPVQPVQPPQYRQADTTVKDMDDDK